MRLFRRYRGATEDECNGEEVGGSLIAASTDCRRFGAERLSSISGAGVCRTAWKSIHPQVHGGETVLYRGAQKWER